MPHRERLGSHPCSRSHRPRIRGGQRDIKNEVWRYAPGSASLLGSTRTGAGEVEDGTLHNLLVKKLPDRQLENYSRWLNEGARQNSVTALQKQRKWRMELSRNLSSTLDHREYRVTRNRAGCEIFMLLQQGRSQIVRSLHVLSTRVSITGCGFVRSFMTEVWMTAGRSLKKKSYVFIAQPLIIGGKIAHRLARMKQMLVLEITTAFFVEVKFYQKPDR